MYMIQSSVFRLTTTPLDLRLKPHRTDARTELAPSARAKTSRRAWSPVLTKPSISETEGGTTA